MNEYRKYYVVFKDPEGRVLHTELVTLTHENWGWGQIESLARFQSKDFSARAEVLKDGEFHQSTPIETKGLYDMAEEGYAYWCKPGAHAFDPDDKGRKRMTFTDYSGEQPVEVKAWACGTHAPNISATPAKPAVALPAPGEADPDYIAYLEWKNGMRATPERSEP